MTEPEQKHTPTPRSFQIRFDGPPGHVSGRFIECETWDGKGISISEWVKDGEYWLLRIDVLACNAHDDLVAALKGMLLSADATWEERNEGHDWREACERARAALAKVGRKG